MKKYIIILLASVAISSCARSYKLPIPQYLNYANKKVLVENVTISYMYDVQFDQRNYRYSKKEKKANLALIGVKIENNGEKAIEIKKENFKIRTSAGHEVPIIPPVLYTRRVRQNSELFALYALGGVNYYYESDGYSSISYNPLFFIIAMGNVFAAQGANIKQKKFLTKQQIIGKTVNPKSTVYGLIAIPENNYQELEFELNTD